MTSYLQDHVATKVNPPQSQPLREDQVKNSAGGYTWAVDDFTRLRRFLILGSAGGSYYAGEKELTRENLEVVDRCIQLDPQRTVREIAEISQAGRAPKNDQAIVALAMCVASDHPLAKPLALAELSSVCRTGTHLFMFVEFLNKLGKLTGRSKRTAISNWYNEKTPDQAAYQAVKYRQRGGWSHRDVLRVAHPKAVDAAHAGLFQWITKGAPASGFAMDNIFVPKIVEGFELAQKSESPTQTASLIHAYNLPREALKTEHLNSNEVWQALLDTGMGMTALIRNLATMTKNGLLTDTSAATAQVVKQLSSAEEIKKARVHPLNVLFALKTYARGYGFRGGNAWTPVTKIVNALDRAFYKAFGNVEPTGLRIMLALDVSGSMTYSTVGDTTLTCRDASAAMAMVTEAVEDQVSIFGFSTTFMPLDISSRRRLDDNVKTISGLPFSGTDCALPMLEAKRRKMDVDLFVVYTDSETWFGNTHPAKALQDYRRFSGINSRLVVVGMEANEFTIADPKDAGMLDVVGFDTATPNIITDFALGRI